MSLSITVRTPAAGLAVVEASGAIDLESIDSLEQRCVELADQGRKHLVLEMSGVEFCDSPGLSTMIRIRNHVAVLDGSFALANVREDLLRILKITGLDTVIGQYPNVDAALAALR